MLMQHVGPWAHGWADEATPEQRRQAALRHVLLVIALLVLVLVTF